jgi:hypothetical protein
MYLVHWWENTELEERLNELARQGWRVVSIQPRGDEDQMIVLEKPAPEWFGPS